MPDAEYDLNAAALPDAPSAQQQGHPPPRTNPPLGALGPLGPVPPVYTQAPPTLWDKWIFYTHGTFGPPSLLNPAFGTAIRMASPPDKYPREWKDGAEAFGRLYGDSYAQQSSKHTAEFVAEVVLHEDPRYRFAAHGTGAFRRVVHAMAFTIVDRTDSGRPTFAVANFAGAAASGFVGMGYLPDGFNDVTHAGQRATIQLGLTAASNISREFAPEWYPFVKKIHLPNILPAWWVPEHKTHP